MGPWPGQASDKAVREIDRCDRWSPGPGYRQIQLAGIASGAGWPQTCVVDVREGPQVSEGVPDGGVIRTPDQRLRVFVSSTLGELAAERQAVRGAITGCGWCR